MEIPRAGRDSLELEQWRERVGQISRVASFMRYGDQATGQRTSDHPFDLSDGERSVMQRTGRVGADAVAPDFNCRLAGLAQCAP
jgi:hypothetical protein